MHPLDKILVLQTQGHYEEARKISDELEALGPELIPISVNSEDPEDIKKARQNVWLRHTYNRAYFYALDGDLQTCYKKLETGRFIGVYGHSQPYSGAPLFNPEIHDIKDKKLLIILEGGMGDEIMSARFIKIFKEMGAETIVCCHPTLMSIFSSILEIDELIDKFDLEKINQLKVDYWLPGFSMTWVSGCTYETIPNGPYLSVDDELISSVKPAFNTEKKKIGIRWAGNPKFDGSSYRKFPEKFLLNLSKYDNVQLYSFQRDEDTVELPKEIKDLQNVIVTWDMTAAYLKNLDLLITSCTSTAHMAAALGVETWVVVPILAYTPWVPGLPNSTTSHWYKSVKLFRQRKFRKWNETFQDLYSKLEEKFQLNHIELPDEDVEVFNLNLGCGFRKYNDFINVDKLPIVEPDQLIDLNVFPWPWKDNSVDNIILQNVLQYLGDKEEDFVKIIKELYRISKNGCKWHIVVPDSQNLQKREPDIKRDINYTSFFMFDKASLFETIVKENIIFKEIFLEEVDISLDKVSKNPSEFYTNYIKNKNIHPEQKYIFEHHSINTMNSLALLAMVHKPMRLNIESIVKHYKELYDEKFIL